MIPLTADDLADLVREQQAEITSLHIVRGDTGEYSDHCMWNVRAFSDAEMARAFCAELNKWCADNGCSPGHKQNSNHRRQLPKCPLDPDFEADYTGTEYSVWAIEVEP